MQQTGPEECQAVVYQPGGVTGSLSPDANFRRVDADSISGVEPSRIQVAEDSNNPFKAGQIVVSNCNDGMVRQVTGVQAATPAGGVSPQGIRTVWLNTESVALEDAIDSGDASINFGQLEIQSLEQAMPGVELQQVTGKITIKNLTFSPVQGVTVVLNGSVEQTLNPRFRLAFNNGSVDVFEAGLGGQFKSEIKAKITVTKAIPSWGKEQPIAQAAPIRRAFLVGSVPVVVVVTPKLVIGASGGADNNITVEAGIAPTLSFDAGVKYDRDGAQKWIPIWTAPTFALNPTFSYTVPAKANGKVYAKMVMDVKFYGLAGPTLEAGPQMNLTLNPTGSSPLAKLAAGAGASASVSAGFNVLGKGLSVGTAPLTREATTELSCTASSCN
jgi:hypothetical protein